MIYETIETLKGNMVKRIKSSIFYWCGLACLPIGIFLIMEGMPIGATLLVFLSPCLLLYPAIRNLFGGKDSVGAVIATVVVEEVIKNEVKKSSKKRKKILLNMDFI